jgi:hypothetical protein
VQNAAIAGFPPHVPDRRMDLVVRRLLHLIEANHGSIKLTNIKDQWNELCVMQAPPPHKNV